MREETLYSGVPKTRAKKIAKAKSMPSPKIRYFYAVAVCELK